MKTDENYKNTSDSYVKFWSGIEEDDEIILEATQDGVSAPKKGLKMRQNEN